MAIRTVTLLLVCAVQVLLVSRLKHPQRIPPGPQEIFIVHESDMSAPSQTIPLPSERYTGWESWRHGMGKLDSSLTLLSKARSY